MLLTSEEVSAKPAGGLNLWWNFELTKISHIHKGCVKKTLLFNNTYVWSLHKWLQMMDIILNVFLLKGMSNTVQTNKTLLFYHVCSPDYL